MLVQRLSKLAEIEADLGGTPELEKMAFVIANRSREMMFFDRAFVAFPKGSSWQVAAVSGVDDVQQQGAVVQNLRDLAREVARIGGDWHFTPSHLEKVEDEEIRARLAEYFAVSDFKSILFMRAADDAGASRDNRLRAARRRRVLRRPTSSSSRASAKICAKPLRRARDFQCLPAIGSSSARRPSGPPRRGASATCSSLKIAIVAAVRGWWFSAGGTSR